MEEVQGAIWGGRFREMLHNCGGDECIREGDSESGWAYMQADEQDGRGKWENGKY